MFGRHNDQDEDQQASAAQHGDVVSPDGVAPDIATAAPVSEPDEDWQHPGTPLDQPSSDDATDDANTTAPEVSEVVEPEVVSPDAPEAVEAPAPEQHEEVAPEPEAPAPPTDVFDVTGPAGNFNPPATASNGDETTVSHELIDIKQQALGQLSPLVDHLEQAPHERFHTLMMMIQATDDQTLVKEAYEAAQQIEDEKMRAQALLDIVNEINYFTQPHHQ